MSNLLKSEQQLEDLILENSLKQSLVLAFERTGTEPYNIDNMVKDVFTEFTNLTDTEITKALRNGSLGYYGKTFKLTTQDICIWIREYRKTKKTTLGL